MSLTLTSSAFAHEGVIPVRHTCDGDNVSPPLSWTGVPKGTRSLALTVTDPDAPDPAAPKTTWVHWVLYDLPPEAGTLPEGAARSPRGTRAGRNDWKQIGYGGPCPPIGSHRYFFELHALDCELGEMAAPTRDELLGAMEGHILAKATLMGTYRRQRT